MDAAEKLDPTAVDLVRYIEEHGDAIVAEWEELACQLPVAHKLERTALRDHVPHLLERIAQLIRELARGADAALPTKTAERHAMARLDEGFSLTEVVHEYSLLRECLFRRWEDEGLSSGARDAIMVADKAIDHAIAASCERFIQIRDRTLRALDLISTVAFEAGSLTEFLERLLGTLRESMPAVDTAVILLREGDELSARATAGLEEQLARGGRVRIGEGFAGSIAAEQQPKSLSASSPDDLIRSDGLEAEGVRAVYGVPLMARGEVVGVVHIGSRTAFDFSEQDKRLVRAMASRATAALNQQILRDTLAQRERQQAAVADLGLRTLGTQDLQAIMTDAAAVVCHTLGTDYSELLELSPDNRSLLLCAGEGWQSDAVGHATVGTGTESQAGYTLASAAPVIVDDLPSETRFRGPPLLFDHGVISGMTVAIRGAGIAKEPYGVLGAHTRARRRFQRQDIDFLQAVANVVGTAIGRIHAEAQLELERARLRATIEQMPGGVIIADAPSGRLVMANRHVSEIWRHPVIESAGVEEYGEWIGFHPETQRRLEPHEWAMSRALLDGDVVLGEEVEILRGDGTRGTIQIHAAPVCDDEGRITGGVVVFHDVTASKTLERERARLHEQLEESHGLHRFLSAASKRLAESIEYEVTLHEVTRLVVPALADWCVADVLEDGVLRRVAVAHADPAKADAAEELRRHPVARAAPAGVALVMTTDRTDWRANVDEEVLTHIAKDEAHLRALRDLGIRSYIATPMIARGRVVGVLTIVNGEGSRAYDENDVAVAEELARRAAFAIDNARLHRRAQIAIQTRENVLAVVSHDLRNPLGSVKMSANLLDRSLAPGDERSRRQVESILRASSRMERLIGDLLDMANIQAGRLAIDGHDTDIVEVLEDAVHAMQPLGMAENVTLRSELPELSVRVMCDPQRITQALANLIGNAIKYSAAGGVVTVRAEASERFVTVSVVDSGPGIPAEEHADVFEPYWTSERQGRKGTGLGLFITRGIVTAHGGRIWLESEPGRGACFRFELPRAD